MHRLLLTFLAFSSLFFASSSHAEVDVTARNALLDQVDKALLAIDHHDKIDPTIARVTKQMAASKFKDDPVIRLYQATLAPVKVFKGIIWRLGVLGAQSDAVYIAVMNALRGIKYRSYLYGPHMEALFDYVNLPNLTEKRFQTVADLQDYLTGPFAKVMESSLAEIRSLRATKADDMRFKLNMQLFTGKGRFLSDSNQRLTFVRPYLDYLANQAELLLGMSYAFSAYDLNELLPFLNRMAKDSLVNSKYTLVKNLLLSQSDFNLNLQTPKEIAGILARKEFKQFLTLRGKASAGYLQKSFGYFKAANTSLLQAYRGAVPLAKLPQVFIFNHERLAAVEDEVIAQLEEREKLFAGQKTLVSAVTGQSMKINLEAIFKPKKDLKKFYPVGFQDVPNHYVIKDKKKMEDVFVWHYDYGKPTKWPDPTFDGFLPGATNKNFYDVFRTMVLTPSTTIFSMFIPAPSTVMMNGA